jgi:Rieske Fe-S protein
MAENRTTRRRTLKGLVAASLAAVASPVAYVFARYLSYVRTADLNAHIKVSIDDLTADQPSKLVTIDEEPVIIVQSDDGIHAFTAKCTHLGCTVSYRPKLPGKDEPGFFCKCHRGMYDKNGINIPGTRPKHPLTPLTIIEDGNEVDVFLKPKSSV